MIGEYSVREVASAPVLTPWMPGPHEPVEVPVVVSVTEFVSHHRSDLPTVMAKGMRMRMGWYAMPGAIGLWLWALPAALRGGSISVWDSEESLQRFVQLPHHVDIMRRYGPRGTVRSATWTMGRFEPDAILDRARNWISGRSA